MTETSDQSQETEADISQEIPVDSAAETTDASDAVDTAAEEVVELSEVDQLKQSLAESESAKKEEQDKRFRAYAELENFRKRKDQEVQSSQKYAAEKVVVEMLPILDNIELALNKTEATDSNQDVLDGFKLIQKQFHDALEKLNVTKIPSDKEVFDPNFHQAISQEDSEEHESGIIIRVMQEGYKLHDRVIRPSLVTVAS